MVPSLGEELAAARLACIRHAASVHPEPGSNSPKKVSIARNILTLTLHYSIFNVRFLHDLFQGIGDTLTKAPKRSA